LRLPIERGFAPDQIVDESGVVRFPLAPTVGQSRNETAAIIVAQILFVIILVAQLNALFRQYNAKQLKV
jgi:hypothetical protein